MNIVRDEAENYDAWIVFGRQRLHPQIGLVYSITKYSAINYSNIAYLLESGWPSFIIRHLIAKCEGVPYRQDVLTAFYRFLLSV